MLVTPARQGLSPCSLVLLVRIPARTLAPSATTACRASALIQPQALLLALILSMLPIPALPVPLAIPPAMLLSLALPQTSLLSWTLLPVPMAMPPAMILPLALTQGFPYSWALLLIVPQTLSLCLCLPGQLLMWQPRLSSTQGLACSHDCTSWHRACSCAVLSWCSLQLLLSLPLLLCLLFRAAASSSPSSATSFLAT